MERLADYVVHHRRLVIGIWILLTAFGGFSAGQVANRWLEDFSIPGASGYEADQRALAKLGNGELFPFVIALRTDEDVTKVEGVEEAIEAAAAANPGSRVSSFFNTGDDLYVSDDRQVTFANIYGAGTFSFEGVDIEPTKKALAAAVPEGVEGYVTGIDALYAESSETADGGEPPSILIEFLIGAFGALVILLFTFGTLPAVAMPLVIAVASILNTFTLIWLLTYITDVSIIVQFLVALVGLGVAIDFALLMIFRFREELRHGADRDLAIAQTMKHAGRSVIVSGTTVAVGLLSMIILPLPFIRSIGIGGMLIPAVSVLTSITLLPALLYTLGPKVNRLRVMPKRIVEGSDDPEKGFWNRWAHFVVHRPFPVAAAGLAVVGALLFYGVQLNPGDAQAKDLPGGGPAHEGAEVLTDAGITAGVHKPFQIVVEGDVTPAQLEQVASRLDETEGVAGAAAPPGARAEGLALVEAYSTVDGSNRATRQTISRLKEDVIPSLESDLGGPEVTVAGLPTSEQEFIDAVYGNFAYVLLFVILLTYVLLARAFRSLLLPLKAVILNLVSLGAAYGIIVFIFQKGHGAEEIWSVPATDSIISWIPLMIFAFLYGLSMDYEVFMLTRMREAYDETGNTEQAIAIGLA
ncbi:MAG: MMPL family transporter, partial [Gaiellaceae bacterium]